MLNVTIDACFRIGFVQPGYDADLVVWDRHPLRVGATPLEVYIDGKSTARASDKLWKASEELSYYKAAPSSHPSQAIESACKSGQSDIIIRGISKSFIGDDGLRRTDSEVGNLTAVIRAGRVVCVGGRKCEDMMKKAAEDGIPSIALEDGHMLPVSLGQLWSNNHFLCFDHQLFTGFDRCDSSTRAGGDATRAIHHRRFIARRRLRESFVKQVRYQI